MIRLLTFFARMGGKSRMARRLITLFPQAKVYVEPFVGAGNILLRLPKGVYEVEVINDKDEVVHQIFHDVQKVSKEEVALMDFQSDRKRWLRIHTTDPTHLPPAARLEHNLYHIYNSYMGGMWSFSGNRSNASRVGTLLRRLDAIQERLMGVEVRHDDYATIIREYDGEDVFMYLDPPYYNTDPSYYKHAIVDPAELRDLLGGCKGKWMLSFNDHPVIRELFAAFKIEVVKVFYGSKKQEVQELVITNY